MSPETISQRVETRPPELEGWPVPTREVMRSIESVPDWGGSASSDASQPLES